MKDKKIVFTFLTTIAITIAIFFGSLFVYDPLMLFHKPFNRIVTLNNNMRIQAPGIIRNLDYDSFIIGTSMMENTSANTASKIIGGHFANISLSGADYFVRSYVLDFALKNNATKIIYTLDSNYFNQREGDEFFPVDSFSYLYSDTLERLKIYLKIKYIKCLLTWSSSSQCVGNNKSVDRPNSWIDNKFYYARFGGLDNWFKASHHPQIKDAFKSISLASHRIKKGEYDLLNDHDLNLKIDKAIQYAEDNIISFVRAYPAAQFYLVFPPYSRFKFAQWHQLEGTKAKTHEAVISYLAKTATELGNLSVYGYEDQDFLDDISNYKDLYHYNAWVDDLILHDIAENNRLLTSGNIDTYLQNARIKALAFDLIGLGKKIDTYLYGNLEK